MSLIFDKNKNQKIKNKNLINNSVLVKKLAEEESKETIRFHMPGHKGTDLPFLNTKTDFTEYRDTDDLYNPQSAIFQAEKAAAKAFGAKYTLFSAGGATLALQACILYAKFLCEKTGKKIYVDRMCHKSVFNALMLCGLEPTWFYPEDEYLLDRITKDLPCFLIITSIDYYGRFRLSPELVKQCKEINCIVACDNSHGTHLAFYGNGVQHPLRLQAGLCIDSAHKTTPCITGGAFLHVSRETNIDPELLRSYMSVFGSTSPSYLIMQSLDYSRAYMETYGTKRLDEIKEWIQNIRELCLSIGISVYSATTNDIFRLCLCVENCPYDGWQLYDFLYSKKIVCEMADKHHVVLITSVCDNQKMYHKLKDALLLFYKKHGDSGKKGYEIHKTSTPTGLPERAITPFSAFFSENTENICLEESNGRISSKIYAPYPPGIPVITPGEVFDKNIIDRLTGYFKTVEVIK